MVSYLCDDKNCKTLWYCHLSRFCESTGFETLHMCGTLRCLFVLTVYQTGIRLVSYTKLHFHSHDISRGVAVVKNHRPTRCGVEYSHNDVTPPLHHLTHNPGPAATLIVTKLSVRGRSACVPDWEGKRGRLDGVTRTINSQLCMTHIRNVHWNIHECHTLMVA